ncbi:ABC transporter substrate-binding protein [Halopelagius longus]|uniref:ABC transporter substrate-binding protein n=1 Tax=Halopelagius longus TaxID=1236180 RepID=A0A1H1G7E2_9EURY|nr:ABC transporter substrate-binding protein [Halopelagius longus]RDI69803.1 ABC transporter substrate-binding protein [Halopelagius longus]SDR08975.1 peptide/nickel transport system substrate-binding protein [Halopelagius longus]
MTQPCTSNTVRRRAVLSSLATGVAVLGSGCASRLRAVTGWKSPDQITLQIKTVPADADPYALRVARRVAEWLRTAGIGVQVTPMAEEELLRQVLLNHEFDLFVAPAPATFRTPDALYPLLHSRFAGAQGWQNPFGYTNLDVDELLEQQRHTSGQKRREAVNRLLQSVATTQPFTVVAFPDDIRAARTDRFTNWQRADLQSPMGYLNLDRRVGAESLTADGSDAAEAHLTVATTDERLTQNLNPLAVEFRRTSAITGLLYDSLGYSPDGGTVEPWLASSWAFSEGKEGPVARVELREATWHDGERLTAADVAFTYAFLADTSLGSVIQTEDGEDDDGPVPAPRFQGQSSLVTNAEVVDPRTVELQFVDCDPQVATRAFTVPVLPEHVWSERTSAASVGGIELGSATEALVTNNIPPVGSGPLEFVRNTPREAVVLERFDDHFLTSENDDGIPSHLANAPAFDRLTVQVVGSDVTAAETVASGDADVTGTPLGAATVPRIGRASELDLIVRRSERFYLVGYNARRPPLTNPRFRNTLAHLVDKDFITREVFEGYAQPAASPLDGTGWLPSDLRWNGTDPATPFLGANGELDVERVREEFRNAGYQYEDEKLVGG